MLIHETFYLIANRIKRYTTQNVSYISMRKPRRYLLMYVLSTQVFNFTFTKAIQWKVACITKWVENSFDEIHIYFFLIPVPLHFFNANNSRASNIAFLLEWAQIWDLDPTEYFYQKCFIPISRVPSFFQKWQVVIKFLYFWNKATFKLTL